MNRIERLLSKLDKKSAYLITHPVDIYYLTGQSVSAGTIVISHNTSFLLVDGRYFEACKKTCPIPVYLASPGMLFNLLNDVSTIHIDQDHTTYAEFLHLSEQAKTISIKPCESVIKNLRMIKDFEEVKLIKEAAHLGLEGYDFVCSILEIGIKEQEVASELEYFWRKRGGQGVAFDPIIAFGSNSAMPHYRASETELKFGDIVLIDIGVKWKHYHSDMTRVVYFGDPDPEIKKIHQIVKKSIEESLKLLRPGVQLKAIDSAARKIIADAGFGEYFTHSLGHGVGLEIHEYPLIKSSTPYGEIHLEKGMVITIEPGIYLPGLGGVRLEDTVVITENTYENLTNRKYA